MPQKCFLARRIEVAERRARLARRHSLAPGSRAGDVVEAARRLVALHGTDPATVYLSAWARVEGMQVADMERALYRDRSLVKHLAMRRTLFVFPREVLGEAQAGASDRVAAGERRRLIRDVEQAGLYPDGARWLAQAEAAVLAALADGREATSSELREAIPLLEGSIAYGEGKSWGGAVPVGPRVLTTLSAEGQIVRASNDGAWTASRPRWASTRAWLGGPIEVLPEREGLARLVARWLRAFGPGTANDLRWWLGSTLGAVRRALADVGAVEVEPGRGQRVPPPGRPGGGGPGGAVGGAAAPAGSHHDGVDRAGVVRRAAQGAAVRQQRQRRAERVVGWADRGRLAPAGERRGGAAAPGGRGRRRAEALEGEAARLSAWLSGTRVLPRFPSPLSKAAG